MKTGPDPDSVPTKAVPRRAPAKEQAPLTIPDGPPAPQPVAEPATDEPVMTDAQREAAQALVDNAAAIAHAVAHSGEVLLPPEFSVLYAADLTNLQAQLDVLADSGGWPQSLTSASDGGFWLLVVRERT